MVAIVYITVVNTLDNSINFRMETPMSSVLEALMSKIDTPTLQRLASQAGIHAGNAPGAVQNSVATVLGALTRGASNPKTAQNLHGLLNNAPQEDDGILDDVMGFVGKIAGGQQANPLASLFGGGAQNAMQQQLSQNSGISGDSAGKLISMVAPLVLGALGREQRGKQMDLGMFQQFLGSERQALMAAAPAVMQGLGGMLDQDGDGDFDLSDMAKLGSKFFGGSKG